MDYYYYYSWTKNHFIGALTKYPPTKRPRDILTQTKRPTNKPSAVTFYYCDVSTLWGFPTATLSPNFFYYYDISSPWNFTTTTFHPFNILLLRYFVSYEMSRTLSVPDRRCRVIPEVVIVKRRVFWGLGKLEGGEWGEGWVRGGGVSLQATWDWGGRILSQLGGFQVSRKGPKRGAKGSNGERQKGINKGEWSKGVRHVHLYIVIHVHIRNVMECLQWANDASCVYIIIIIGMNVVDNLNSV